MSEFGEPWRIALGIDKHSIISDSGTVLHDLNSLDQPSVAKRIVACVNFCQGLPTEDLVAMAASGPLEITVKMPAGNPASRHFLDGNSSGEVIRTP